MRIMVVAALAVLLAGCTTDPPGLQGPGTDREVGFVVEEADRAAGRCFDGATAFGDVCDRLRITVDNTAYTNPLDVGPLTWQARDTEGRTVRFADTDGHEEVPGGKAMTIQVSFTLDDGAPRLARLVYEGFQGHGEADVPEY